MGISCSRQHICCRFHVSVILPHVLGLPHTRSKVLISLNISPSSLLIADILYEKTSLVIFYDIGGVFGVAFESVDNIDLCLVSRRGVLVCTKCLLAPASHGCCLACFAGWSIQSCWCDTIEVWGLVASRFSASRGMSAQIETFLICYNTAGKGCTAIRDIFRNGPLVMGYTSIDGTCLSKVGTGEHECIPR